jgi:hypothetical protein
MCSFNLFPHMDVFWRLFVPPFLGLRWKMPYLGPKHCFPFKKFCWKSDHFFGKARIKMMHHRVARRGMCLFLFWGFEGGGALVPLIAKKILDMWQAKNGLRSILRWRVTNAEKPFTLSHCIEKLQHFEIRIWWEKTMQNNDFSEYWDVPRCHGNRKLKSEQVVTDVMNQSTYVPSFISIEAFFIVL